MNKTRQHRLFFMIIMTASLGLAAGLILYALKQNINVYLTPSELTQSQLKPNYQFRLGGMVKNNSIIHHEKSLNISFIVTDLKKEVMVQYNGVLPDLFHEGKGVIADGKLNSQGIFIASQILAKHDENYMPKSAWKKQHA